MPRFCSSNHHHHQKKKKISTVQEIWCKYFRLCLTFLKLQEAWLKCAHHHSSGRDPTTQKSPQNQKQIKTTRPRSVLCGQEAHSNNKHGANHKTISKMFMNKNSLNSPKGKKKPNNSFSFNHPYYHHSICRILKRNSFHFLSCM